MWKGGRKITLEHYKTIGVLPTVKALRAFKDRLFENKSITVGARTVERIDIKICLEISQAKWYLMWSDLYSCNKVKFRMTPKHFWVDEFLFWGQHLTCRRRWSSTLVGFHVWSKQVRSSLSYHFVKKVNWVKFMKPLHAHEYVVVQFLVLKQLLRFSCPSCT